MDVSFSCLVILEDLKPNQNLSLHLYTKIPTSRFSHKFICKCYSKSGILTNLIEPPPPNSLLMNCNSLNLQIAIDPTRFVGLESVADAVEHLHSGKSLGKVCKFLCCFQNVKKIK